MTPTKGPLIIYYRGWAGINKQGPPKILRSLRGGGVIENMPIEVCVVCLLFNKWFSVKMKTKEGYIIVSYMCFYNIAFVNSER